ncbi:kelch repeat-containing protein, partial [Arthrospira platensis SPKY1]|nr:kelch repeat-containing protein [Arthrospira platensis SPKY1]
PLNFVWMNLYNDVGHIGDTAYFLCNEEQTDVYRLNLLHASTEIASTHYEHTGGTMVAYDGKLYLAGAYSWNDSQFMSGREKLEIYDPSNNTWREGADLPDYRCFMGAFVLDEQIYFLGGQRTQGYPQNNVWK